MKKFLAYSAILMLASSCKIQQFNSASLCGSFEGVEGTKNTLSTYVLLELNSDNTCLLRKSIDLSNIECRGQWVLNNDSVIEIRCNDNPILNDVVKALQSGYYCEEPLKIYVLSK